MPPWKGQADRPVLVIENCEMPMKLKELLETLEVVAPHICANHLEPSEVPVVVEVPGDSQRLVYKTKGAYFDVNRGELVVEVL